MKVTTLRLKQIIKEELHKTFEALKKTENAILVDLYDFSNLVTSGASPGDSVKISGVATISSPQGLTKDPITMTLTLVDEEPEETIVAGTTVPVKEELVGRPFNVTQFNEYTFVLNY